jgi:hypothetical protein
MWIDALNSSTVDNFKENEMVNRMLGEIDAELFSNLLPYIDLEQFTMLDNIGRKKQRPLSGTAMRMIYYALQIIEINPRYIIEIGGGVGQFFATLRMLGYKGTYTIADLPEVKEFQNKYLQKVSDLTWIDLKQDQRQNYDLVVSFYALGEFDDATKQYYIENVFNKCAKGFIIWNPHSGANSDINFECKIEDEHPVMHKGNKRLTWG